MLVINEVTNLFYLIILQDKKTKTIIIIKIEIFEKFYISWNFQTLYILHMDIKINNNDLNIHNYDNNIIIYLNKNESYTLNIIHNKQENNK